MNEYWSIALRNYRKNTKKDKCEKEAARNKIHIFRNFS